jgi:hypothetical protein
VCQNTQFSIWLIHQAKPFQCPEEAAEYAKRLGYVLEGIMEEYIKGTGSNDSYYHRKL